MSVRNPSAFAWVHYVINLQRISNLIAILLPLYLNPFEHHFP